jgi:Cu(I)/Ag(I) efflux system membrane fusion protein
MRRIVMLAALAVWACGGEPQDAESPMPGMTAEEHARMLAGGTAGTTDSTGAEVRSAVQLTPAQERALGVTYTTVRREPLARTVRTVGTIVVAETEVADVTPKIEGFVERLYVNATGAPVRAGQPLLALYAPMLVAVQEELLTARRLVAELAGEGGDAAQRAQAMLDATRRRLGYWDISAEQVARLEQTGEVTRTLTLSAPVTGVVLEKEVVEGQRVMPGMRLYRIANLGQVWVEGEVFEQDLAFVREGSQAHIEVAAYRGEHRMGRVTFVYPTVDPASRTNRVRVVVPNPDGRLKPGMFATLYFDANAGDGEIVVPTGAVVVTGERNLVFVRDSSGALQPRQVVLGARSDHRVQVLEGLVEGDVIVASANFLVDAESRLAGHGTEMPGMQHGAVDLDAPAGPPARPPAGEHRHD